MPDSITTINKSICYHEVVKEDLSNITSEGLLLDSNGEKDTSLIMKVNEFLDAHRTPNYRRADVSRVRAIYGYLATSQGVISITTGEEISLHDALSDNDHVLLQLHINLPHCYVSDLDLYDTIKENLERKTTENAISLARLYWDSLTPLSDYSHGNIRRPELIITYPIPPHDIKSVLTFTKSHEG